MLIDSHAHIQGKEYADDIHAVLARARAEGVQTILAVGGAGHMSSNSEAVALAERCDDVYASVGMHPHDAKEVGEGELRILRDLTEHPKVIAVGETGLDYYYNHSTHDVQRAIFGRFITMARETRLPIIVHERDAASDAAELLRSEGRGEVRGVIHCFTGSYEAACTYLDMDFYLSFTGIITFKNADALREVVRRVPLEKIMVETDSPYLTPVPYRGKRNEPAFVRFVAATIAELKGVDLDEVGRITTQNASALFGIQPH